MAASGYRTDFTALDPELEELMLLGDLCVFVSNPASNTWL